MLRVKSAASLASSTQHLWHNFCCTELCAVCLGVFPGEGGLVAPGMSCQYRVQFIPEYLADYDDQVLAETQSTDPLVVPLKGRRPPPILSCE